MNITNTALKLYLTDSLPIELTKYFTRDYAQIFSKVESFKKKNSKTPSIDFLLQYSSKMGEDKEQSGRIEDILYVVSKIKNVEMSVNEVGQLFLEEYKSDRIRDLIKRSSTAIVSEDMILVEKLSKEIASISGLSLSNNQWLETDIKDDIKHVPSKLELVNTGIFKDNLVEHPFSSVPVGSLILIIARSGRGKSTLTLQSAINLYLEGKNVLNINVELQKPVILGRIKSNITGIPLKEISSGQFLTEDAETLNKIYDYVMAYKLELEDGLALVKKVGLEQAIEKFEALPRRENILKIISATDKATQDYAKSKGMKVEKLPNDVEILQMLEENGEYFDAVYIDLVSELKFADSSNSREANITSFTQKIKELAMEKSFIVFVVSQVENGNSFWGQLEAKYAKSLTQSSDLAISIIANSEMSKDNLVGLVCPKTRHNSNNLVTVVESEFATMRFKDTFQTVDIYEFEKEMNKEFSKKREK